MLLFGISILDFGPKILFFAYPFSLSQVGNFLSSTEARHLVPGSYFACPGKYTLQTTSNSNTFKHSLHQKDIICRYSLPKSSRHCMFHTIDVCAHIISCFTIRIYKKNGGKEYLSATLLIQKLTENGYWLTYTWTFGWLVTHLLSKWKMNNDETLPKALRTQVLTALTSNFGLVGLVRLVR